MVVEIEGVALHLAHPDELTVNWVGQDEVMRQLLAAWLVVDPQDLPMNPGRITGLCGRLRCCLAFEHPLYRSFRDRAPAVGRTVATPNGRGIVRSYEVLKDACVVELDGRTMVEITLDQMVEVAG